MLAVLRASAAVQQHPLAHGGSARRWEVTDGSGTRKEKSRCLGNKCTNPALWMVALTARHRQLLLKPAVLYQKLELRRQSKAPSTCRRWQWPKQVRAVRLLLGNLTRIKRSTDAVLNEDELPLPSPRQTMPLSLTTKKERDWAGGNYRAVTLVSLTL